MERRQLRWVALAAALVPVAVLIAVPASLVGGPYADTVVTCAAGTVAWLLPVALGAAVLRYRLDDLDRIISRTVACALLTLLLGGGCALAAASLPASYLRILMTRPAPTVRPPSRMAKRSPSAMAIGAISFTVISVLSPGIAISVPSGSCTSPVTSVVRK